MLVAYSSGKSILSPSFLIDFEIFLAFAGTEGTHEFLGTKSSKDHSHPNCKVKATGRSRMHIQNFKKRSWQRRKIRKFCIPAWIHSILSKLPIKVYFKKDAS